MMYVKYIYLTVYKSYHCSDTVVIILQACQSPVVIDILTIIQSVCKNLHNAQKKFLSEKEGNFIIEHYSGPVTYSIEDLLSKNTDKVLNIFYDSERKLLTILKICYRFRMKYL